MPEEAVSDVARDGAVDELSVAVLGVVSSLGGAVPLLLPDVLALDGEEVDEDELGDAAVLCVVPFDDELSRADEDVAALPPDVLAVEGGRLGEEEAP